MPIYIVTCYIIYNRYNFIFRWQNQRGLFYYNISWYWKFYRFTWRRLREINILYYISAFVCIDSNYNFFFLLRYIYIFRLQEADLGFVIVIDRRNDKWSSVRTVLLRLAVSKTINIIFILLSVYNNLHPH